MWPARGCWQERLHIPAPQTPPPPRWLSPCSSVLRVTRAVTGSTPPTAQQDGGNLAEMTMCGSPRSAEVPSTSTLLNNT